MKKILFLSLIVVSSFTLSACTVKDQLKTKVLDKATEVQNKVNDQTDEEMLKELSSDDSSVDNDFNELETELQ